MSNEQLHVPVRTGSGVKVQLLSLKSKIKPNINNSHCVVTISQTNVDRRRPTMFLCVSYFQVNV